MPEYESLANDLREAAEFPGYGIGDEIDVSLQRDRFYNAMDDDLDLPTAIESLREISRMILEAPEEDGVRDAQETLRELLRRSGIDPGNLSHARFTISRQRTCYNRRKFADDRRRFFVCLSAPGLQTRAQPRLSDPGRLQRKEASLRPYEMMIVLAPDVPEDELDPSIDTIEDYVTRVGGEVIAISRDSPWGRRRLAYPIRHAGRDVRDGYYALYYFDCRAKRDHRH